MNQETTLYEGKPHWIYLTIPAIIATIGLCCTALLLIPSEQQRNPNGQNILICCTSFILIGALTLTGYNLLAYLNWKFTVTSRRIILEKGILAKSTQEIFINKVESVSIETPILGRILDYGKIIITGSGGAQQSTSQITHPKAARDRIQELISQKPTS